MAKWIGPGYPFTKGLLGYPNIKEDAPLIRDSIIQILSTRKGERFFNREFGSNLHKLVFEPNDEILKDMIQEEVVNAIKRWEPRVEITKVDTVISNNRVDVLIEYKIKGLETIDSVNIPLNR